jgi:hypothetical protein
MLHVVVAAGNIIDVVVVVVVAVVKLSSLTS